MTTTPNSTARSDSEMKSLTARMPPEGVSGDYRIEHFTVTPEEEARTRIRFWRDEHVPAGAYVRLMRGRTVVMSDTPMEMRTNWPIIRHATGNVLINGLGIGMVLRHILAKPDVRSVTVIEIAPDVIRLTGPSFIDDQRVNIVHASAFDYQPPKGQRYDAVWHDIWDFICADNLDEMKALHRKYGRRTDWQSSWCREECERQR